MNFTKTDTELIIEISGNVDTSNAEEVGKEMFEIRDNNPGGRVILDIDNLKYISSAGLRQLLRMRKQEKNLKIINASAEIYDIFEMTGFSEMIEIVKAFRKMSVEGCEVIGEGSNGIVYQLNPDTIIKVYKNSDALDDIKRERELARKALVLGLNTAIPYDVVRVGDKYGSVFEMLSSKSLTKHIKGDMENADKYIRIFVNLAKEIHSTPVDTDLIPYVKDTVVGWVKWLEKYLPAETYNKLLKMVNEVPEPCTMIHGDYHANNVHYDGNETIIIDMDTLAKGHPIFELASIFLAYVGYGETNPESIEKFMKLDAKTCAMIWEKFLDMYFEGTGIDKEDVRKKAMCIGYVRALRRTIKRLPDEKAMIDNYYNKLVALTAELDNLYY